MADQQENKTSYPIPSLLLIAAIIAGGISRFYTPLDTLRPPLNETKVKLPTGAQKVLARMWQDPFQAVEKDLGHSRHTTKLKIDWYLDENHLESTEIQSETFKDTKDSKDFKPELNTKDKNILILPVMIKAGIYQEDVEDRLRSRYAVLSALHVAGYKPNDAEHIGIFEKDIQGVKRDIPYERFLPDILKTPKSEYDSILVLWLGDEYFSGKLLEELSGLFKDIKKCIEESKGDNGSKKRDYTQIVLGPTDSTAIEDIISHPKPLEDLKGKFKMYSASATIATEMLKEKLHLKESLSEKLKNQEIDWQSTIHTDLQLTGALVAELERRGIGKSDHIVLISEWDTGYGRALPMLFKQSQNGNNSIDTFTYMRGIDGMLPGTNDASNASIKKPTNATQKGENHPETGYFSPAFEQPSGQSQFDYLLCLSDNIKYLDQDSPIRAIGVLGSDVYDKLLILRALRDQFPQAIFFTTDLDARLYYYTELPWTRNLIVVSSYGLQLHPDLQKDIPPFRSTYQTSLFVAALKALNIISEIDIEKIDPRIFEIGNQGPYDLTVNLNGSATSALKLHPDRRDCWGNKCLNIKKLFYLFFMYILPIMMFSGLFYYNIRETKKIGIYQKWKIYWTVFLVVCIYSFVALTFFAFKSSWNEDGEPLTFFDGISIWPTELIRLFSGFLAVYFLLFSIQSIIRNNNEITRLFEKLKKLDFWEKVQRDEKLKKKWVFLGIAALVYLGAGYIFILVCGKPPPPFRGNISWWADICILLSSLFFMLYLIMFVIYRTWCCIKFINKVIDPKEKTDSPEIVNVQCSIGNDECRKANKNCTGNYDKCLTKYNNQKINDIQVCRFKMKIIDKRTEVIGEMIKYPFLILFLLVVARLKYFDNWTWTIPLAIVIGLTTLLALCCTILLFHTAKRVRQQTIDRLRDELINLINTKLPENINAFNYKKSKLIEQRSKAIEFDINEFQNLKSGAFSPFISNPIFLAILTPLGGMGSISLLQLLSQLLKG